MIPSTMCLKRSRFLLFPLISVLLIIERGREWSVTANAIQRCIPGFSCRGPSLTSSTSLSRGRTQLFNKHSLPYSSESSLCQFSSPNGNNIAASTNLRRARWYRGVSQFKTPTALNLFFGSGANSGNGNEAIKGLAQPTMFEAMKKATDLIGKLKALQEAVAKMECKASDGEEGSMISVVYTGSGEPKSVEIQEGAMSEGTEQLQKRIYKVMKEAWKAAGEKQSNEYSNLYKEFGLPIPEFKKMMNGIDLGSIGSG
ncbi:hypothetical protein IE077_002682 [Cardiosporidium cionae]|uniref:Uncharacterized protein n=1 Tax=Cardiosporidium cionae TaxID=476202 RepID=A0ABQ7JA61_9APIC|nr:hypothetical protein IE077_002682 [Cardiosporidium cionae]|eukprot:KAF8820898.1 hypothetical protein IE077_002682 [Cardiosporidium cionae]